MFRRDKAEDDKYIVEWIQQNEVNDIYRITRKSDGYIAYDQYPRSMFNDCTDLLEDVELYGYDFQSSSFLGA